MSTVNGATRSKLLPPSSSRLTNPASRLTKPQTTTTRPAPVSKIASSTTLNESDISSIKSNDDTLNSARSNVSSSTSLGSISMARTSSIGSRGTSTVHRQQSQGGFNNRNETYSVNGGSNGKTGELVKDVEEVIARNKILEEENSVLKGLIHEESEKGSGRFDERRVLLLKCQVYQLEKQINILSKSLAFRKNAHTDSLNTLSILADTFRSTLQQSDSRSLTPTKTFNINRAELVKWTELAESTRIKLTKTEDTSMNEENVREQSEPSLFTNKFVKAADKPDILDICSGNLDHISLKQVGQLESGLSSFYKKVWRLNEALKTIHAGIIPPLHKDNLKTQLNECLESTQNVCRDLFDLALLVPSAPWSAIKKSPIGTSSMNDDGSTPSITQEKLLAKLKSINLPKLKYQPVETLLKSYYVSSNYHHHMRTNQLAATDQELQFYRQTYSVHKGYVNSVMQLFANKYSEFVDELRVNLTDPVKVLVDKFWLMKNETSEENLKEFLGLFKNYAKKFDLAVKGVEEVMAPEFVSDAFAQVAAKMEKEVAGLSRQCDKGLDELKANRLELDQLSRESDYILGEIISVTPNPSDL